MASPMKNTLKTFGTFSTPSYGGVGEPFDDKRQLDARTTGRQFTTNKSRHGQIGDNWNRGNGKRQPVQRLFEGEKYIEQFKLEQKHASEQRKLNLTENGFRYPSAPKKDSGLGNYYGCIGPKHTHLPEYDAVAKGAKPGPVVHEMAQILTSNPKKGYGASTPGCIFGPGPLKGESGLGRYGGREYAHATDPYDSAHLKEKEMAAHDAELIAGRPPFKTAGPAIDCFDGKPDGRVATSGVFTEDPRLPERPPSPKGEPVSSAPFFPAKAPRSGPMGTFNRFPTYMEDPLAKKLEKAKEEADKAKLEGVAPFKPPSKGFTTPQPSIAFRGLQ